MTETTVAESNPIAAGLAELQHKMKDVVYDVTTTTGMNIAKIDRLAKIEAERLAAEKAKLAAERAEFESQQAEAALIRAGHEAKEKAALDEAKRNHAKCPCPWCEGVAA